MSLKKRVGAVLSAMALCLGALALNIQPASAVGSLGSTVKTSHYDYKVCNSSASASWIKVWDQYVDLYEYLYPDECQYFFNDADNIRVDVDPDNNSYPDISSYKIGHIDYGYGPCHVDSESAASNPPNDYKDTGVRYRNYTTLHCSS